MNFVDYKCLESLLIEGEEMIATEGIGSAISGITKKIFGMISGFINAIIGIFRGLINKLRGKKPKKITPEELKKANVDTFKSEPNKSNTGIFTTGERFGTVSQTAFSSLRALILAICRSTLIIRNSAGSHDISDKEINTLDDQYTDTSNKLNEYISKYSNSHNVITNKSKEFLIEQLNEDIETLEDQKRRADKLANEGMGDLLKNEKECLNLIIKVIPKAQNYATKISVIINNCEISE